MIIDKVRTNKMMWRWSLVTAGLIALFWTIWYLLNGEVPVIDKIVWDEKSEIVWQLPFTISRWWDILIGPIWSIILIKILTSKKISDDKDLALSLVYGLVFGLVIALVWNLIWSLVYGLGFGLVFGLVIALVWSMVWSLVWGLVYGLGFGLVIGLVIGLVFGLVYGLVFSLVYGLVFGLIFIISRLKPIFSGFWSWLMAENRVT